MNQKIQFNDIPNFTSKFDILFVSNSVPKIISEQQIQREFNEEKWKVLLNRIIAKDFNSIEELLVITILLYIFKVITFMLI